jgi:copper chaperone NosL
MNRYLKISAILLVLFIMACNPESQPINYGSDMCEFCRMSIVDQRFGAEIVTQKGKVYKFDAAECMVNYLDKRVDDESHLTYILTNTLDEPGKLVDVRDCRFLISKNMPSPMGMYINPFRDSNLASTSQAENSGLIYDWTGLREEFKTK